MTMTTFEWAELLKADGITVNVVHPGDIATGLMRSNGIGGVAWTLLTPFLMTEEQGSVTPLHAALSPSMEGVTGCYIKDRRIALPNSLALDPTLRRAVWTTTESLIEDVLPERCQ
jgi:NAD(P)-dependent dehydrogenase (short-subunit alcohol dehydrogenase family)